MDQDVETLVRLAIEQLRDGRPEDALLTLERTVWPKWSNVTECDGQLRMFDPDGPKCEQHDFFAMALGMQVAIHLGSLEDA